MKLKEKECTEVINITKEDLHFHYDQYFSKTLSHGNLKGWGVQCSPGFPQFTIHPIPGIIYFHKSQIPKNGISFSIKYTYEEPEIEDKEENDNCLDGLTGGSSIFETTSPKPKGDTMFEDMINKHVTVFRKDGNILQGFITEVNKEFIKMTELDNNKIIFNKDCIDLIRLGIQNINTVQQEIVEPKMEFVSQRSRRPVANLPADDYDFNDEENPAYDEKAMASTPGEFAMALPRFSDDIEKPKKPTFYRVTEKE